MKFLGFIATAASLTGICATSAPAKTNYVKLTYRSTSGIRPYVPVKINGRSFSFMVHANAGFYAMTTHRNADTANISNRIHKDQFGITGIGVKSPLGRDAATAKIFSVGGSSLRNMPMQIFEIPPSMHVDGMIGVDWLKQVGAMVDYNKDRLAIPEKISDAETERRILKSEGYIGIPMHWDAKENRYFIDAKLNGGTGRFVVSTVAQVIIDENFANQQNIETGGGAEKFGGPTGKVGELRETSSAYTISINGLSMFAPKAHVYDIYAYDGTVRPQIKSERKSGYLGCDFMKANGAVIDFGSETLFVKLSKVRDR